MSASAIDVQEARVRNLTVDEEPLTLDLVDGRTVIVPLAWYPRLWHGTQPERENFEILAEGAFIHWPDLDEDLSTEGIVEGRRSGESASFFKRWLEQRARR